MKLIARFVAPLLAVTIAGTASADVRLPALVSDGMVLQQGVESSVWGWADGEKDVKVTICGQTANARVVDGKWRADLKPLKAGGPFKMTIAGKNTITLSDILVGEVWVCSGQSNMQFNLKNSVGGEEAIATSANEQVRLFKLPQTAADAPAEDCEAAWVAASPKSTPMFSAVGYYFGRALQRELDVPIGLIQSSVGGTNASSWISRPVLEANPDYAHFFEAAKAGAKNYPAALERFEKTKAAHAERVKAAKAKGKAAPRAPRAPNDPLKGQKRLCGLYYGMISPLQPFAIKGAIWYQGEANSHSVEDATQYRQLLGDMVQCWRDDWGCGDFAFYIAQLPGFGAPGRPWPLLRESQNGAAVDKKNTGVAVTIELGMKTNIHPTDKDPVGERLALLARAKTYGEDVVYSGPVLKSAKPADGKIALTFDHVGSGLEMRGDAPGGFEVAGEDGVFVPAKATIRKDRVIVSAKEVADPKYVRYAFKNWPECSLFNKEGLSAGPFRTDDLPFEPEIAQK